MDTKRLRKECSLLCPFLCPSDHKIPNHTCRLFGELETWTFVDRNEIKAICRHKACIKMIG